MKHWREVLQTFGVIFIVFNAVVRLCLGTAVLPYWDQSPLVVPMLKETTLTPFMAFAFDALAIVGAAFLVFVSRRLRWGTGLCIAIGSVPIVIGIFEGLARKPLGNATPHAHFDDILIASAWLAALIGTWGLTHLDLPRLRALAIAAVLGGAFLPVAKSVHQYTVGHDQTMAEFRRDRAAALEAQGLREGSSMARSFERRLSQREASGWIGLSNVYATTAGMLFFSLAVGLWFARGTKLKKQEVALLSAATLAAGIALLMTHSKGGYAAALLAAALAALPFVAKRHARLASLRSFLPFGLVAGAVLLPLAAVVIRGLVGGDWERSLLFRWHYLVASVRIFLESPWFGVGADGFQSAYLIHKVPTNPEVVASPHSVFFDWLTSLGLFALGFAWILTAWGAAAVRSVFASLSSKKKSPLRSDSEARRTCLLAILATTAPAALAIFHQSSDLAADLLVWLVFALLVCIAIAWILTIVLIQKPWAGTYILFPAALLLLAHAQIEMTPIRTASAAWVFAILGLSAFVPTKQSDQNQEPSHRSSRETILPAFGSFVALMIAFPLFFLSLRAHEWEGHLRDASASLLPLAVSARIQQSGEQSVLPGTLERAVQTARRVSHKIHSGDLPSGFEPDQVSELQLFSAVSFGLVEQSHVHLSQAAQCNITDPGVLKELAKLELLWRSSLTNIKPEEQLDVFKVNAAAHAHHAALIEGTSSSWLLAAEFARQAVGLAGQTSEQEQHHAWVLSLYEKAIALGPYEIRPAHRYARFLASLDGYEAEAAEYARLALRNDELHRLDPLVRLTGEERDELEAIAGQALGSAESQEG